MYRWMEAGPWIIPIKVSPVAGHFCLDRGHQNYPNLSGFSDRPLDFREICPDNWIGLQNLAKNHLKLQKYELAKNRPSSCTYWGVGLCGPCPYLVGPTLSGHLTYPDVPFRSICLDSRQTFLVWEPHFCPDCQQTLIGIIRGPMEAY